MLARPIDEHFSLTAACVERFESGMGRLWVGRMLVSLRVHIQISPLSFVQAQTDLLIPGSWPLLSAGGRELSLSID